MAAIPFPDDANFDVLKLIPMTPLGFAKPANIAAVAVFIASPQSGNLSGALVPIDGAST